jgi:hypothetical protein
MNFFLLLFVVKNASSPLLQASTDGVITPRCVFMLSAFAIFVAAAFLLGGYFKNKKNDNNYGDTPNPRP